MQKEVNLKVERVHPDAVVPKYAHDTDAAFDLYAADDAFLPSGVTGVPLTTGLRFLIPEGYHLEIFPRSGWSKKTGLRISNAPGLIDQDYRGEVFFLLDNLSPYSSVRVNKGQRIAQALLKKTNRARIEEVTNVNTDTQRGEGGFGSTGE